MLQLYEPDEVSASMICDSLPLRALGLISCVHSGLGRYALWHSIVTSQAGKICGFVGDKIRSIHVAVG